MMSHRIPLRMRNFSGRICRESQNTRFILKIFLIMPFMRQCWKILYSRTGHRRQHGACALHAGYLRLQTHTRNMKYYCFSTATMVVRTRLNVNVIRTLPCILYFIKNAYKLFLRPFYRVLPSGCVILSMLNSFFGLSENKQPNKNGKRVATHSSRMLHMTYKQYVYNLTDAIPLCDITKAYTDIYVNTQQLLLNTSFFLSDTW